MDSVLLVLIMREVSWGLIMWAIKWAKLPAQRQP